MLKKTFLVLGISTVYFLNAQDVSTLRNTIDIYSNSTMLGSSKYNAMAGAMGALGGDASTINSNPAGIAVSIASEISGTLAIINNKNTTTIGNNSNKYKIKDTDLGNVGGVAAFRLDDSSAWKFVNVGINYTSQSIEDYSETPSNQQINFDIYDGSNALIDNLKFDGHAYNRYGYISKMSIAAGGNYDHRFYVGAGLNFHSANVDQYDSAAFLSNTYNSSDIYNKQYTPFSESANGFSASVGIIGKINPQFRLGASVETPTWWTINRVYEEYANPIDGTYVEDRTLTTPLKTTLSAAFVPNKNFAINVDYSIGLSKPKYKVDGPAETELNNFFKNNGKNSSEIRAGAEYRMQSFRLRAGYSFANSPFDSMSIAAFDNAGAVNTSSFDQLIIGKRSTIGAGLGYDFKSFYIDAAYQNIQSDYNNPMLAGSANTNTGYFSDQYIVDSYAAVVSNVKNVKDNFLLTLGWKF